MDKNLAIIGSLVVVAVIAGTLMMTTPWTIETEREKDTTTITDMVGREVEVPKNVDNIVGLGAGSLRLITFLNHADRVVGVEDIEKNEKHQKGRPYLYAHPELSELPSIGPMHGGKPELISTQNPDVIFWTYTTKGDANDLQKKTGIPVVVLKYGDLGAHRETIYEGLTLMGKILDKKERAEEVIQYIRSTIQDLKSRTENIASKRKPETYVGGVSYKGSYGIGGTEPKYAPFQFVNAKNPADNLGMEHVKVSKEKIIEWDPDIIFVDEGSYPMVVEDLKKPEFKNLRAFKNDNIFGVLPQSYYTHNFGIVLADSYYVGKVLYPERFKDIEPEEKADEIYEELVGEPIYDEIRSDFFGGFKRLELPE